MKQIWKFVVPEIDTMKLQMPIGAQIVSVQNQNNVVTFWALVDPKAEKETRYFTIYGTGHSFKDDCHYIGTVQMNYGLVWHLFEIK